MTTRREGLVAARNAAGHTQESLAEALGVDVKSVRSWENGKHTPVRRRLQHLARELRISRRQLTVILFPSPAGETNPTPEPEINGKRNLLLPGQGRRVPGAFPDQQR